MKVMCIRIKWSKDEISNPSFAEIVTVTDRKFINGKFYLRLLEYPLCDEGLDNWFWEDGFIPLSDINELELIEQRLCTA